MTPPAKKAVPSLKDLLDKDNKEETKPVDDVDPDLDSDESHFDQEEDKEVKTQAPRISDSGGLDNSNSDNQSSETVTHPMDVINKTQYDPSGNGVTDNFPVDYTETDIERARNRPNLLTENATVQGTVYETVYATPAEVDDKGFANRAVQTNPELNKNNEEVVD